jgi:Fe2+ transport system protein FeoA
MPKKSDPSDGLYFKPNDIIQHTNHNTKKFVIISVKHGTKWVTVEVMELDNPSKIWVFKTKLGAFYDTNNNYKYIGKTDYKVTDQGRTRITEIDQHNQNIKDESRNRITELGIEVGDEISIKGRPYNWQAIVGDINLKDGRVGLVKYTPEKWRKIQSEKTSTNMYFDKLSSIADLNNLLGRRVKARSPREFRWISANSIDRVVEKNNPK